MRSLLQIAGTIGILSLLALAAGCIDLKPQGDPTRFFVLRSIPFPAPAVVPEGLSLRLKQIELPDYLKSPKMVLRRGDHEIVYSDFNRWGEDLDDAIGRSVANNLVVHSQIGNVSIFPWKEAAAHQDYTILISIQQFEGSDKEFKATLRARWEIYDAKMNERVYAGTTEVDSMWNGKDYAAFAQTLSKALEVLTEDLIIALKELDGGKS